FLCQSDTGRQIETLLKDPFRDRIPFINKQTAPVEDRLFMHSQEEGTGLHTFFLEFLGKSVRVQTTLFAEDDTIHPIDIARPALSGWQLETFDVLKPPGILVTAPALVGNNLLHALHLREPERRLDVGKAKVEAQSIMEKTLLRLEAEIAHGP